MNRLNKMLAYPKAIRIAAIEMINLILLGVHLKRKHDKDGENYANVKYKRVITVWLSSFCRF